MQNYSNKNKYVQLVCNDIPAIYPNHHSVQLPIHVIDSFI